MVVPEAADVTDNSVYRDEPRQFDAIDVNGNRLWKKTSLMPNW